MKRRLPAVAGGMTLLLTNCAPERSCDDILSEIPVPAAPSENVLVQRVMTIELNGAVSSQAVLPTLHADSAGIYVVDVATQVVSRFDTRGRRKWSKRSDEIVGERGWVVLSASDRADSLVLLALRNPDTERNRHEREQKAIVVSSSGKVARTVTINTAGYEVQNVFAFDERIVAHVRGPGVVDDENLWKAAHILLQVTPSGPPDTILSVPGTPLMRVANDKSITYRRVPFSADVHITTAGDMIIVAAGATYEIMFYDSRGNLRERVARPHEPIPISDVLITSVPEHPSSTYGLEQWHVSKDEMLSRTVPAIGSMVVGTGRIAVHRADKPPIRRNAVDSVWVDVIDPHGPTVHAMLPPGMHISAFDHSTLYSVATLPKGEPAGGETLVRRVVVAHCLLGR